MLGGSNPHRHQDVERLAVVILAQQRRRCGVGEVNLDRVAFDLVDGCGEGLRLEVEGLFVLRQRGGVGVVVVAVAENWTTVGSEWEVYE